MTLAEAKVQEARRKAAAAALDAAESGRAGLLQAALDIFGDDIEAEARERAMAYLTDGYTPPSQASPTSRAAAAKLTGEPARTLAEQLLALIAESGVNGMTCEELHVRLGAKHQSVSGSLTEMFKHGVVARRGVRPNSDGNDENVHILPGYVEALDPLRVLLVEIAVEAEEFTADRVRWSAEHADPPIPVSAEDLEALFRWAQPNVVLPGDRTVPSRYGGETLVWTSMKFKGK